MDKCHSPISTCPSWQAAREAPRGFWFLVSFFSFRSAKLGMIHLSLWRPIYKYLGAKEPVDSFGSFKGECQDWTCNVYFIFLVTVRCTGGNILDLGEHLFKCSRIFKTYGLSSNISTEIHVYVHIFTWFPPKRFQKNTPFSGNISCHIKSRCVCFVCELLSPTKTSRGSTNVRPAPCAGARSLRDVQLHSVVYQSWGSWWIAGVTTWQLSFCQKNRGIKLKSKNQKPKNQIDLQKINILQLQDVHFKLATICKPRFFEKVP